MSSEEIGIFQYKNKYRYNTFSLLLAKFALKNKIKNNVLDLCAGCGVIGILLKKHCENIKLSLLEIQNENISLIQKNLAFNKLEAEILEGDFANFSLKNSFDFIVCNPPFYNENVIKSENLHKKLSKNSEALPLEILIKNASLALKNQGVFYFCYEAQKISEICVLLSENKLKLTKICPVYTNHNKDAKLLLLKAQKNAKTSTCFEKAVILNQKSGEEIAEIYDTFKVKSYDL